jgi:hypothetical protein
LGKLGLKGFEARPIGYNEKQTHLWAIVIIVNHGVWPLDSNNKSLKKSSNVALLHLCA